MRIMLIGGAGFVGHHLALHFKAQGHDPIIIDSFMVNNRFSLLRSDNPRAGMYLAMIAERMALLHAAGVSVVTMDARDYTLLSHMVAPLAPDVIIHLAAVAHIDRSNKDPFTTFDHSLRTLENALDVARNCGTNPHFVYFSSSTVYGNFPAPVLDETSECHPFGIYGAVKLAGEHIVRAYQDIYGLPCTTIRPCALYGPRCVSGRVGQKFIEAALDNQTIMIFGDGEVREDFTYIGDLVKGIDAVVSNREAASGETFNITAGEARSLNDLATTVRRHFNVKVMHGPADPEKPHRGTMDIGKAKARLGYEPKYRLENGIAEYVEWYRRFKETSDAA